MTCLKTSDFYYDLPERLIAQSPIQPRDAARMMVIHRDTGLREDRIFRDITEYRLIPCRVEQKLCRRVCCAVGGGLDIFYAGGRLSRGF